MSTRYCGRKNGFNVKTTMNMMCTSCSGVCCIMYNKYHVHFTAFLETSIHSEESGYSPVIARQVGGWVCGGWMNRWCLLIKHGRVAFPSITCHQITTTAKRRRDIKSRASGPRLGYDQDKNLT